MMRKFYVAIKPISLPIPWKLAMVETPPFKRRKSSWLLIWRVLGKGFMRSWLLSLSSSPFDNSRTELEDSSPAIKGTRWDPAI